MLYRSKVNYSKIQQKTIFELFMALLPYHTKNTIEAGCDEAGRGCLAGPVFAAAVILPPKYRNKNLDDSKKLTEKQRYELRAEIEKRALAFAVVSVGLDDIDKLNILWASIAGMHRAVDKLAIRPESLLIDGNRFKPYPNIPHHCIIEGDGKYLAIAAASILAKTYRDDYMAALHIDYPEYNWLKNKGYATKAHREAIRLHGPTPHHRMGFALLPNQLELEF